MINIKLIAGQIAAIYAYIPTDAGIDPLLTAIFKVLTNGKSISRLPF